MVETTASAPHRRRKGDVEWVSLEQLSGNPDHAGMHVGVRHDGPGLLREHGFRLQALRLEELRRVAKAREGLTAEIAPELWDGLKDAEGNVLVRGIRDEKGNPRIVTPEGMRAAAALAVEIVATCVVGARGTDVDGSTDGPTIAAEMARLGVVEMLMPKAMEVQSLTRAERFPAADPGDVR